MKMLLPSWTTPLSLSLLVALMSGAPGLLFVMAEPGFAQVDGADDSVQESSDDDWQGEGDRFFQSGLELREQGDFTEALTAFEAALAIYEDGGDRQSQIDTLNQIGNVHLDLGQHEQAAVAFQGAIALQQQEAPQPVATASATPSPESGEAIGTRSSGIGTSEESSEDWGESGGSRGPSTPDVSTPPLANPGPPLETGESDWGESGGSRGAVSQQDEAIAFHPPETSRAAWGSPGGSRGSLPSWHGTNPTALVTDSQTVAAHPTIFIYLPALDYRGDDDVSLEFAIWGEVEELYTLIAPPPSTTGGILGIYVEESEGIPPLEVNQQYEWLVWLRHQSSSRSHEILDRGWIERVGQDRLGISPEAIPLAEQPYTYRDAGLWYDAVRALFEIRQMNPEDETNNANLQELLDWVGLEDVTAGDFLGYWSGIEPSGEAGGEPVSPSSALSEPAPNTASDADEQPSVSTYHVPPSVAPPSFGAPGGTR